MTVTELGAELSRMYHEAPEGESVVMIHLFGVRYAAAINAVDGSFDDIVKAAGIAKSYATEVRKGVNLAKYVRET